MHAQTPQGYAPVNQAAMFEALAKRAKLEKARDAALDMLFGMPRNPTTSESRAYLNKAADTASQEIDELNRVLGLGPAPSRPALS